MTAAVLLMLELGLRALAAAILLVSTLYLASSLTERVVAPWRGVTTLRLAATAVSSCWILGVTFNLLIVLHAFTLAAALVLLTGLSIVIAFRRKPRSVNEAFRFVPSLRRWWRLGHWRRPWMIVAASAVGISAVRVLFVPPVAWDANTYHLVKAALWVQGGGPIRFHAPGGGGMYMGVPGGVDSLWAWVMLPFHSDLLVGVADVVGTAFLGLGVYVMARELGVRSRHASMAAAFVLAMPAVLLAAGSNYVDTLNAYFLTSGTAFCLQFLRHGESGWAILAGMAFGTAAATKLTGVPMLAIAMVTILWRATRRPEHRGRGLRLVLRVLVFALLISAPWYLQNWIRLGHPFSPYPVRLGALVLGASPDYEWFFRLDRGRPYSLSDELAALKNMFHVPFANGLGDLTALPVLMLPIAFWRFWKRKGRDALFVLALLGSSLATYWDPRFSVVRLGWADENGRYFLLAIALAVSLGFLVSPGPPYTVILGLGIALNIWALGGRFWTGLEFKLILSYLVFLISVTWLCTRPSSPRRRTAAAIVMTIVGLGVAQLGRDSFRATLGSTATLPHAATHYPAEALKAIDGRGSRLAFTAGPYQLADNWYVYPFLGSRLQNEPIYVPISRSGRFVPHTDPAYLDDVDREAWLRRLESLDVAAVISFPPAGPELAWMEDSPERFRRIAGTQGTWGLYERLSSASGPP
jgi:hypothetical protein